MRAREIPAVEKRILAFLDHPGAAVYVRQVRRNGDYVVYWQAHPLWGGPLSGEIARIEGWDNYVTFISWLLDRQRRARAGAGVAA